MRKGLLDIAELVSKGFLYTFEAFLSYLLERGLLTCLGVEVF